MRKHFSAFIMSFLAVLAGFQTSWSQNTPRLGFFSNQDSAPISIDADKVEAYGEPDSVIFQGNVKAVQEKDELTADQMIINYATDKETGKRDIESIEAIGEVVITTETYRVSGDKALYILEESTLTLTGNSMFEGNGVSVKADGIVFDTEKKTYRFLNDEQASKDRVRTVITNQ